MSERELIALMAAPIYAELRSRDPNFEEASIEKIRNLAVIQAKALWAIVEKLS